VRGEAGVKLPTVSFSLRMISSEFVGHCFFFIVTQLFRCVIGNWMLDLL
jgi:hypothetical protein